MAEPQQQHLARTPLEGEGGKEQVGLADGGGWRIGGYDGSSDEEGADGALCPLPHVAAPLGCKQPHIE